MTFGSFRINSLGASLASPDTYWFGILSASGGDERFLDVKVDASGNIFFAGQNSLDETGRMFKYNSTGVLQWQFVMPTGYVLRAVALDSSGNPYLCGGNETLNPARPFLIKLNPSTGAVTWQVHHTSDLTFSNEFYGMEIDSSSNINLCGRNNNSSGYWLATFIRYTTNGTIVSSTSRTHQIAGSTNYAQYNATVQSGTTSTSARCGGYYTTVGGNRYAILCSLYSTGPTQVYYLASVSTGSTTSSNNTINSMVYDSNDLGYFAVGGTYEATANRVLVLKMASGITATATWARYIQIPTYATGCCLDSSGNLYVTYNSASVGYITKFNNSGTHQWTRTITAPSGNILLNSISCRGNSLIIAGSTTVNSGAMDPIVWVLPTDGSKTGTFNSWVIASATPTVTTYTPTFTSLTGTSVASSRTNTASNTTATPTATTMTSTSTNI